MNLVVAAASAGQGVALGDELTCGQALKAGRLVRPFDLAIRSAEAYYLVTEHHRGGNPAMLAFSDWLKSRLVQTRTGPAPCLRGILLHAITAVG